jgi:hypothetical protein
VDATIVVAPKQRNTEAERAAIKAGQIPEGWAEKPAKLRQKDRDARWTVKFSKARPREDGAPQVDPRFRHLGTKTTSRSIASMARSAAGGGGRRRQHRRRRLGRHRLSLGEERGVAGRARPGLAHPSQEAAGPADGGATRRANARRSAVRSAVEHVFARQKGPMALVVRTIGIARARVKIGLANLAYNMKRLVWLSGKAAPA